MRLALYGGKEVEEVVTHRRVAANVFVPDVARAAAPFDALWESNFGDSPAATTSRDRQGSLTRSPP